MTAELQLTSPKPHDFYRAGLSQWFTPPKLAKLMADLAEVEGKVVLEPSAGDGALVKACLAAGASRVYSYEIDNRFNDCTQLGEDRENANFINLRAGKADVAVMNPPFEDAQDVLFTTAALRWCPVVVVLAQVNFTHGIERQRLLWRRLGKDLQIKQRVSLARRPKFSGSEGSPMRDFAVWKIGRVGDGVPVLPEITVEL